jgi:hypothetical protein
VAAAPTSAAKKKEWVKPRWPNIASYGMPKEKAITSMSGNIAQTAVHVQNGAGKRPGHHRAAALAARA